MDASFWARVNAINASLKPKQTPCKYTSILKNTATSKVENDTSENIHSPSCDDKNASVDVAKSDSSKSVTETSDYWNMCFSFRHESSDISEMDVDVESSDSFDTLEVEMELESHQHKTLHTQTASQSPHSREQFLVNMYTDMDDSFNFSSSPSLQSLMVQ